MVVLNIKLRAVTSFVGIINFLGVAEFCNFNYYTLKYQECIWSMVKSSISTGLDNMHQIMSCLVHFC